MERKGNTEEKGTGKGAGEKQEGKKGGWGMSEDKNRERKGRERQINEKPQDQTTDIGNGSGSFFFLEGLHIDTS